MMGVLYSLLALAALVFCGWLLYLLCRPFVGVRPRIGAPLLVLLMGGALSMVIWIGDPNLLFTFPVFVALFMLATNGERLGRLSVCFIFFCLTMSLAALFDTYISYSFRENGMLYDVIARLARLIVIVLIVACFHRFLPKEPVALSRPLWALVFALSLMPLSALASTVLLTAPRYASA